MPGCSTTEIHKSSFIRQAEWGEWIKERLKSAETERAILRRLAVKEKE